MNLKIKINKIIFLFIFLIFNFFSPAFATVRYGAVPGRNGLSFKNIIYSHNNLSVEISNRTKTNVIFGGTMIFLDRHSKPVARAEILPARIRRRGSRRFRGVFTEGTGEAAVSAARIEWDLSQRNN